MPATVPQPYPPVAPTVASTVDCALFTADKRSRTLLVSTGNSRRWNVFFLGFILIRDPPNMTLPLGIMNFRGAYITERGLIFAGVTISIIPVVGTHLLLSRQFIAGLTVGSVKG